MKYKSKPVVIEAVQITSDVVMDPQKRPPEALIVAWESDLGPSIYVDTPEGRMKGSIGDWLITGTEGEHYLCKDVVFKKKYEPAE
jgi:hypothetical protein